VNWGLKPLMASLTKVMIRSKTIEIDTLQPLNRCDDCALWTKLRC